MQYRHCPSSSLASLPHHTSLSASLTCPWRHFHVDAINLIETQSIIQIQWSTHSISPRTTQDKFPHAKGPNKLSMPTDAIWKLDANQTHHPKQTWQIHVRRRTKWAEYTRICNLLSNQCLLFFVFVHTYMLHQKLNIMQTLNFTWITNYQWKIPINSCPFEDQTDLHQFLSFAGSQKESHVQAIQSFPSFFCFTYQSWAQRNNETKLADPKFPSFYFTAST
jgi:hypothetical protein